LRAESPSTSHPLPLSTPPSGTPPLLPIPLPTSSPPLLLPSTNGRVDVPEVTLPPRKRLCIALGLRFEVDESLFAPTARPTRGFRADYGFVGTLDDEIRRDLKREDEEEESFRDDVNDKEEDEDEEEEEHPDSANSVPPPVHRVTTGCLSEPKNPYHFLQR
nr:hypothetical protein [Tanacetum cinerariifolium]